MRILVFIFMFILVQHEICLAYDVQCRYITNYQDNMKKIGDNNNELIISQSLNPNPSLMDALSEVATSLKTAYYSVDDDMFYCTYHGSSENEKTNAVVFMEKLRDKKIIPLFFYDGWTSKFYEQFDYDDINTPFSQTRTEGAGQFEFVFKKKSR